MQTTIVVGQRPGRVLVRLIEAMLANDEVSSDEELVEEFVRAGVGKEYAEYAVSRRGEYMRGMVKEGSL